MTRRATLALGAVAAVALTAEQGMGWCLPMARLPGANSHTEQRGVAPEAPAGSSLALGLAAVGAGAVAACGLQKARRSKVGCSALSRRENILAAVGVTFAATAGMAAIEGSRGGTANAAGYPVQGSEELMKQKEHGTSPHPVQDKLRWDVDHQKADEICSYNRNWAEYRGYWRSTAFAKELSSGSLTELTFYDSVTGKPLFIAPKGRSLKDFEVESKVHGWPSFRDEEVVWDNVRCLRDGECVSVDGTHLGHNIPDEKGNRYCINLVSVAGMPVGSTTA